jgi:hypothetical protein
MEFKDQNMDRTSGKTTYLGTDTIACQLLTRTAIPNINETIMLKK